MRRVPLKWVANITSGQSPNSRDVDLLTFGTPFLQGNAEFGKESPTARFECDKATKICNFGDVLVSVRAPVGALNIADQPYGIGRGLCALRSVKCDERFLWWWLHSQIDSLRSTATGTTYSAVTAEDLGHLPFPLIEQQEQRLIANFLDAETARIDHITRSRRRQQALVRDHLDARVISTLLNPHADENWSKTRLKYLFTSTKNGTWGDDAKDNEDDIVCVRVADFRRNEFRAGLSAHTMRSIPATQLADQQLRYGDVLLEKSGGGESNPVGFAVSFDGQSVAVCSNFIAALRPADDVDPRFAALLLAAMYKARMNVPFIKQTTGIQNLDGAAYLSQHVNVPRHNRQASLAQLIDRELSECERLASTQARQVNLLIEKRHALITAAVTGQIDVTTAGTGVSA